MDPIERGLRPTIPLTDAADYFMKLKYGSAGPDAHKIAAMKAKMKEANMGLPDTAMGKNMAPAAPPALPPTGMGQNKMAAIDHDKDVGEERGRRALHAKFEKDKHTKGERIGSTVGSVVGAAAGAFAGKHPATRAAGALIGYGAGSKAGREVGKAVDRSSFKKHASIFKQALSDMFGEGMTAPGTVSPQVDMSQYLEMEQMGEEAEQQGQAEFLRQKLQDAYSQLQSAQDQAQMANQTAQQLQMQQSQHEQQLTAAQQQSQLATQAAMQNVQQAHELAMKATTQALQSKDDAINTHQMAAQMRMAYQDMRGQIMDTVAQDNAAPIGEAIKQKGLESQVSNGPMAPGGEVPGAENTNPDMQPQEGGPAEQAPGAQAAPNAAPMEGGEESPKAPADGSGGGPMGDVAPSGQIGTQEQPGVGGSAKQAGAGGDLMHAGMGYIKGRLPHMAAGAAIGGGLGALESQMGTEGLEQDVNRIQGQEGGFGKALRLAAAKAKLTIRQGMNEHPVAGSLMSAGIGAAGGATLGPGIMEGFKALPGRFNELRGKQ